MEVHIDDLDEETKKFVEKEVVTVLLPENYRQTLGMYLQMTYFQTFPIELNSHSTNILKCIMYVHLFIHCFLLCVGSASSSAERTRLKQAHGRCSFIREPHKVKHSCDICGFTTTEMGLQKHKLRNHPEHYFVCEVGYTFFYF